MKAEYLNYLDKLNKYNEWERKYLLNLPIYKKIKQFILLYQMKQFISVDHLSKIHDEHLEFLVYCQKMLLKGKS